MSETYFAKVNAENVVVAVQVVTQQFIDEHPEIYTGTWVETFIDVPGKTYAGIGYIYDPTTNNFVAPQETI